MCLKKTTIQKRVLFFKVFWFKAIPEDIFTVSIPLEGGENLITVYF